MREVSENYSMDSDGLIRVTRSQDVQSLIDQNKHEAEAAPSMFGQAAVRKIGSIPFVVADQWSRECGAGIGTKEFAVYCKRKLMDGDFAAFRIKEV
ncbi:hypothetical protein [Lentibacter algarum]|uniref:hypothetical protein n=1 Tax=Lentibacter algarum TaxID=576131 RepID=UPI0026EE8E06|nr:hypothetical protein [Lentibacter algarum]